MNKESNTQEHEFIPAGQESSKEKYENMSESERIVHSFADGMNDHLDQQIADNELASEEVGEEYVKPVDINLLTEQFNSVIDQSRKCGSDIADTIHIKDLSEESNRMLENTVSDLTKLHHQKSVPERLAGWVPPQLGLRKKFETALDIADRQVKRNQTVREFATNHFNALEEKKQYVDRNRESVDKIQIKLEDSSLLLGDMLSQAKGSLEYMNREGIRDKGAEIKAKTLVSKISNQLVSQRELIRQTEIFESVASVVSEHIDGVLPQIHAQFIDQVSISSSLTSLKDFQDSVKSTQDLLGNLKTEALNEMGNILSSYEKDGIGESKKTRELRETHFKKAEELQQQRNRIESNHIKQLDESISQNMDVLTRHEKSRTK